MTSVFREITIVTQGGRQFDGVVEDTDSDGAIDDAELNTFLGTIDTQVFAPQRVLNDAHRTINGLRNSATELSRLQTNNVAHITVNTNTTTDRVRARFRGLVRTTGTPQSPAPSAPPTTPEVPEILDRTAFKTIQGIAPAQRSQVQHFLWAIAQANVCSRANMPATRENRAPAAPVGGTPLDEVLLALPSSYRYDSTEDRFNTLTLHMRGSQGDGSSRVNEDTSTPHIFSTDHGLNQTQRTQLIRWLERSSLATDTPDSVRGSVSDENTRILSDLRMYHDLLPSDPLPTRSTSQLAVEFIRIHERLVRAYGMYQDDLPRNPTLNDTGKKDKLIESYARVMFNRMNPAQAIDASQRQRAEQELLSYSRIVETFHKLNGDEGTTPGNNLPTLPATPANRRTQGGGGGGGGGGGDTGGVVYI
ncbi:MAG: hypothetical protein IPJ69_04830 [Deltaproteobacteria bacterium]|nr:MAG: hypothetical protein IPJ69_04830 [Deltaproteobacteria bacterium]